MEIDDQESTLEWNRALEKEFGFEGRYKIVALTGSGGMGEVFQARQLDTDRVVAIKILSAKISPTPEVNRRFLREAQVLSTLDHPNIVRFYVFGVSNNRAYQVVDFLDGISLAARLEKGPLSIKEAQPIFNQIADALKYASARGIVHRDIKPANIFLCPTTGGALRAVLLDFGLVRQLDLDDTTITTMHSVLGTPLYMSPEQCKGGKVDHRSDIYSLGCTMYEALTGAPPFLGNSVAEVLFKHMNAPRPAFAASIRGKQQECDLSKLIEQCMEKDPDMRPNSFEVLLALLDEAFASSSEELVFGAPGPKRKNRQGVTITMLAVILFAAFAIAEFAKLASSPTNSNDGSWKNASHPSVEDSHNQSSPTKSNFLTSREKIAKNREISLASRKTSDTELADRMKSIAEKMKGIDNEISMLESLRGKQDPDALHQSKVLIENLTMLQRRLQHSSEVSTNQLPLRFAAQCKKIMPLVEEVEKAKLLELLSETDQWQARATNDQRKMNALWQEALSYEDEAEKIWRYLSNKERSKSRDEKRYEIFRSHLICEKNYALLLAESGQLEEAHNKLSPRLLQRILSHAAEIRGTASTRNIRDLATELQSRTKPEEASLKPQDQLIICDMLLDLCDVLKGCSVFIKREPSLEFAHQWFNIAYEKLSPNERNGKAVQERKKKLYDFDQLAAQSPSTQLSSY